MKLIIQQVLILSLLSFGSKAEETASVHALPIISEQPQVISYETNYEGESLPFIARDLNVLTALIDQISNPACRQQCHLIVAGLRNLTTWAVEFYDASGKLPEGVLR